MIAGSFVTEECQGGIYAGWVLKYTVTMYRDLKKTALLKM